MTNVADIKIDGINYVASNCLTCGVRYFVPWAVWHQQAEQGGYHHCTNGHSQGWSKEASGLEKLRRERNQLKQQAARLEDEKREAVTAANAARKAAEAREARLKRRISAGTCPCCQRTVSQLARHMATKHPDFTNVVALKEKSA